MTRKIRSVNVTQSDIPAIWSGVREEIQKLPYSGNAYVAKSACHIDTLKAIALFRKNMLEMLDECDRLFGGADEDSIKTRHFLENLKAK